MTSYDSQRRGSYQPPPDDRLRYASPARNPDYDPYAPQARDVPRPNPYGPTQPVVIGTPPAQPQHPGLRRESLSYQPPPNPSMAHPGLPQSSSYHGGRPEQYFGTPPQGSYFPQGPQSQPQAQQYSNGYAPQQYPQQPYPQQSYPPQTYPQNLHPDHIPGSTPPRRSNEYEDGAVKFDDSAHYHPSSYAQRPRAYSTASRTSRRTSNSRRDEYDDDDSDYDYERRRRRSSHSSGGTSHKKHRRYSEEPRVTVGDSMMWAFKKGKELLSSKRE